MKAHVVKPGEYLEQIAFRYGFDADTVWSARENAELGALRKDHHILAPGDILYVPDASRPPLGVTVGGANRFECRVPTTTVRIAFKDTSAPFANKPYIIEGLGAPVEGKTNDRGEATFESPLHLREVRMSFPDGGDVFRVQIGGLDPASETSGVRGRLENLGYRPGLDDEGLREALRAFQAAHQLPTTGEQDSATLQALHSAHGR